MPRKTERCPGSGQIHSAGFLPEPRLDEPEKGKPASIYPGAGICIHCSQGILFVRSTLTLDEKTGYTWGALRVHSREKAR